MIEKILNIINPKVENSLKTDLFQSGSTEFENLLKEPLRVSSFSEKDEKSQISKIQSETSKNKSIEEGPLENKNIKSQELKDKKISKRDGSLQAKDEEGVLNASDLQKKIKKDLKISKNEPKKAEKEQSVLFEKEEVKILPRDFNPSFEHMKSDFSFKELSNFDLKSLVNLKNKETTHKNIKKVQNDIEKLPLEKKKPKSIKNFKIEVDISQTPVETARNNEKFMKTNFEKTSKPIDKLDTFKSNIKSVSEKIALPKAKTSKDVGKTKLNEIENVNANKNFAVGELTGQNENNRELKIERADLEKAVLNSFKNEFKSGVNDSIVRSAKILLKDSNYGEIRLLLKPESLGSIRINLHLEGSKISGDIIASNSIAAQAINENISSLTQAFKDGGLEIGGFEVSLGQKQGQNGEERREFKNQNSASLDTEKEFLEILSGNNNIDFIV